MDTRKKRKNALKIIGISQDYFNSNKNAAVFILNDDCMLHIFSFLLIKERIRIQRVCKKWQNLTKLPWNDIKELQVSFLKQSDTERIVYTVPILKQVLYRCGTSLTKLQLGIRSAESGFNKPIITLIRKLCPNLKSLDITNIVLTAKTAEFLADHFCDLTSIAIGDYFLGNCTESISKLFLSSKQLRSVKFKSVSSTIRCFSKLSADLIESLSFGLIYYPKTVTRALSNFKKLRSLSVNASFFNKYSNAEDYLEEILLVLPVKAKLDCLYINAEGYSSDKVLLLSSISYFLNLRRLSLGGKVILHDDVLAIIGRHCKHLSYLSLSGSPTVTDTGLESLFPCLNLESLVIHSLSSVSEKCFVFIQMPSLNTFYCSYCKEIDVNEAVRILMLGSLNLRQVEFIKNDEINLNLNYIVEEASAYVENRLNNHDLKLGFHGKNLCDTRHISKNLRIDTQSHNSDPSDDEE